MRHAGTRKGDRDSLFAHALPVLDRPALPLARRRGFAFWNNCEPHRAREWDSPYPVGAHGRGEQIEHPAPRRPWGAFELEILCAIASVKPWTLQRNKPT